MNNPSFFQQAKRYLAELSTLRSAEDLRLIDLYSKLIECAGDQLLVAIPCHVRETGLFQSLAAYAGSLSRQSCLFVVFLNADGAVSESEFDRLAECRRLEIAEAQSTFASLKVISLVHHFSGKVIVSRVRGLLTDAIIKACYEHDMVDPVIVSNDADALHYSLDYLSEIRSCFARSEQLDYVSGPVYWSGCDGEGMVRYQPGVPLPEIYLGDLFGQEADELYRLHGVAYSTGCNTAFRLSSLCAINGYDYDFAPHFDVEIGAALNRFRKSTHPDIDLNRFAGFSRGCALTTNPRRAIHALLSNIPYGHQFDTVGIILGADLGLAEYIAAYRNSNQFIQASDLLSYHEDEPARRKIQARITANFLDFVSGEPTSHKEALAELLCAKVGLVIESIGADPQEVRTINFDWTKTELTAGLVKWIKSIPQPPVLDQG